MADYFELLEINTDGGARGNPGPAAIGASAVSSGEEVFYLSEAIGETTNNVAEYMAVVRSLQTILEKQIKIEKLRFILDSELIVKQITGQYKVKQPHLQTLRQQVVTLIKDLEAKGQLKLISFINVPREQNKRADELVNLALDK